MSIRFKFRSSANFDSVDIEGRPSISVRDLRSKIVRHKHLNICQDFDLVFSDAATGREYDDDNFQIPSGSCVIIKRIPAGTAPSALAPIDSVKKFGSDNSNPFNPTGSLPLSGQMDEFDDFGVDLCPAPKEAFPDRDLAFDNSHNRNEKTNILGSRFGCQKFEAIDLSEDIPKGSSHTGIDANIPQIMLEVKYDEHMESEKVVNPAFLAVENAYFPSELKCSLCNTFFKEAVMIPCCQHSFCGKCIRRVLIEKARCPKCFSGKCRVEDLLPNLSLRQAIEHFLESQNLVSVSGNALRKDVPDGESGIQAEDASCAVTLNQKEPDLPHSPSATEKGSNQIMPESVYESLSRKNASAENFHHHINLGAGKTFKPAPSSHRVKQIDGKRDGYAHNVNCGGGPEDLPAVVDFQGETLPCHFSVHDEADYSLKRRRNLWVDPGGGDQRFIVPGRYKKGDRTCYACGSPDHFIRDCPFASSPHPMIQTGNVMCPWGIPMYASPYWNASSLNPMNQFSNICGNPGMVPSNTTVVPVTPFSIAPYMPSMYGGLAGLGRTAGIENLAGPVETRAGCAHGRSEFLEPRNCENGGTIPNENLGRGRSCVGEDFDHEHHHYNEQERSRKYIPHAEIEASGSSSDDSFTQRSQWKHPHDKHLGHHEVHYVNERREKSSRASTAGRDRRRPYLSEKSNSEVEDMPNSSNRSSREKHKCHHRSSREHERSGQYGAASSSNHHQTQKEKDAKKRAEFDVKGSNGKRHSHSESGPGRSHSDNHKNQSKEKHCNYGSKHSRHCSNAVSDELSNDRWKMVSGSDEDCNEGHHRHKRTRVH